ncbi:hypothetical protein E5K21_002082 [Enterococcus faecalis]|nr:hypothetical protein [Enterococcus faecalis]
MESYIEIDKDTDYSYVLSSENFHKDMNKKTIKYYNEKIHRSQRMDFFSKNGHYFLDFLPSLFVRGIANQSGELEDGHCEVTVTDLFSKKKLEFEMDLATLVPNTQYVYGVLKEGRKVFGGACLVIDNCLHYKEEFDNQRFFEKKKNAAVFCCKPSENPFPLVDWRLDKWIFDNKYPLEFLTKTNFAQQLIEYQQLKEQINLEKKYKYGVFCIREVWTYPIMDEEISIVAEKVVVVQAFSPEWLKQQRLPENTPILGNISGSGSARSDMKFLHIHEELQGEKSLTSSESQIGITLEVNLDNLNESTYTINQQSCGGGRVYKVNEQPKWTATNPQLLNQVVAFPFFSSDFVFRTR